MSDTEARERYFNTHSAGMDVNFANPHFDQRTTVEAYVLEHGPSPSEDDLRTASEHKRLMVRAILPEEEDASDAVLEFFGPDGASLLRLAGDGDYAAELEAVTIQLNEVWAGSRDIRVGEQTASMMAETIARVTSAKAINSMTGIPTLAIYRQMLESSDAMQLVLESQ